MRELVTAKSPANRMKLKAFENGIKNKIPI